MREQQRRTSDNYSRVTQEWEDMKVKNKTKVLLKEITDNLEGEVGNLKEKNFNANLEKLAANKKKIENADQEFRAD